MFFQNIIFHTLNIQYVIKASDAHNTYRKGNSFFAECIHHGRYSHICTSHRSFFPAHLFSEKKFLLDSLLTVPWIHTRYFQATTHLYSKNHMGIQNHLLQ